VNLKSGIHIINNEAYHADPVVKPSLSRSMIREILNCPAKAFIKHPRLNPDFVPDEPKSIFDIGTASHSLLLEGVDNCEIIYADDKRTKAVKEKIVEARAKGRTPLLEKEYDKTIIMVERAEEQIIACPDLDIIDLQKDGKAEQTFIWKEKDGIGRESWHRIRTDWLSNDFKVTFDYKTTGTSADPNWFAKHIADMNYDIQEPYYRRGIKAVTGIDSTFIFVVQETTEPFLCSFIGLSPQYQEMGKQKAEFGIFLWNQCMESGKWEGYPKKICYVEPPAYTLTQWEQKSMEIGV
jgi:hypothetical protein